MKNSVLLVINVIPVTPSADEDKDPVRWTRMIIAAFTLL